MFYHPQHKFGSAHASMASTYRYRGTPRTALQSALEVYCSESTCMREPAAAAVVCCDVLLEAHAVRG
jgi:hypothetical protein